MQRTASLPIFLESRGGRTLQDQIYRSIRQSILEGLVGPGRRLPSTRMLATDLRVSRTTALLALEQLRAEGYVVARRGSGMFIAPRLPEHSPPPGGPLAHLVTPPLFSRRGYLLSRTRPPDRRLVPGTACAFRLGTPALDLFPAPHLGGAARANAFARCKPAQRDYSQLAGLRALARGDRRTGAVAWHSLRR